MNENSKGEVSGLDLGDWAQYALVYDKNSLLSESLRGTLDSHSYPYL